MFFGIAEIQVKFHLENLDLIEVGSVGEWLLMGGYNLTYSWHLGHLNKTNLGDHWQPNSSC